MSHQYSTQGAYLDECAGAVCGGLVVEYGQYGDQASKDNNQNTRHAIDDPVLCTGKHSVASHISHKPEHVVCVLLICHTLQAR